MKPSWWITLLCACVLLGAPGGAAAAPSWRLEQPAPPAGAPGQGPVGEPADLQFLAPNFGLMLVDNPPGSLFASGLLVYDGTGWRQLSTVCGAPARSGRIALVSENEWWTVSRAVNNLDGSVPTDGTPTLCHFQSGAVVGSYATALSNVTTPFASMNAAACTGPSDCWFGGPVIDAPSLGSFLLHWDGASLQLSNTPRPRAIADMAPLGGSVYGGGAVGSAFDGTAQGVTGRELLVQRDADAAEANGPRLLRRFQAGATAIIDWPRISAVEDLVDIRALDSTPSELWLAGRDASDSYVPDDEDGARPMVRAPYLARMRSGDAAPTELTPGEDGLAAGEFVSDIAVLPDGGAWVAIGNRQVQSNDPEAVVARLDEDGRVVERVTLRRPDVRIGGAAKIDCTGADQCWMVTAGGWVYHFSEPGAELPRNPAPAIQGFITTRPRDERTPTIPPDVVVKDESRQYVAPPPEAPQEQAAQSTPKPLPALLRVLGKPKVVKTKRGRRIVLRVQVRRRARVQLVGRRGGRTVAKTKRRTFKPGRYTLRMSASPRRWPTSLKFVTTDLEAPASAPDEDDTGGGSDDTVST